jgi:hypothetical protein
LPGQLDLHRHKFQSRRVCIVHRDGRLRVLPRTIIFASLLLFLICTSCSTGGSAAAPASSSPVTVTVLPNSAKPFQGGSVQFSAAVKNASSSAVYWQVNGTTGGSTSVGMIDPTGLYSAPTVVPAPPTVTVSAVLQSDSTKTGSSSVTIQSLSSVTGQLVVSPVLSSVTTSQTLQFNILTPGISNTDVTWTASAGTITPGGNYTPPGTPGAYLVEASLPNAKGFATVEVTNFPGTLTWRNDNSRSGVNSSEMVLAPATVSLSTFGKLFSCPIDGYAYAQPLYVPNLTIAGLGTHNVVFIATEKDTVFAFDADANPCVLLWKTSLIPAGSQAIETPNFQITSTDIVPFVGITGTPVIGGSPPTLYVVAATQTIALNPTYSQQMYALNLTAVPPQVQPAGAGVEIATPSGSAAVFNPMLENQRPALLLVNGTVYIAFGSYGGQGDYHGWLFAYNASSLLQTGVFDVTPDAIQGGIWQSGGGPSADSNQNVFVATGEGPFDVNRGGMSYSDSFLRLGTAGGLAVSDYFTPCDQAALQAAGQDVGSGAPVLLLNSSSQPDLLIGGSKSGSLYAVNPYNMGNFVSSPCPDLSATAQTVPVGAGPIMSTPLFWNNAIYVAPGSGNLMSFPMSGGIIAASPAAYQSPETIGPQGATPVISSNGTNSATNTAILWLIDSSGALATPNAQAVLRVYDPNNLSNEIYNSAMVPSRDQAGLAVKFTVPTVANGKVYVGTQGELDVYGLLQ